MTDLDLAGADAGRHQLRRGRPLAAHQAWGAVGAAVLLVVGVLLRTPWLAPLVLPAALLAPGYVIIARVAAAVEFDSGEGLWRTLALRLVASVATWTAVPSVLVLLGADPAVAVWLVAAGLAAAGLPGVVADVRSAGPAGSLADAVRSGVRVLRLRHVSVLVAGSAVVVLALVAAVAVAGSGPRGVASSRASYVSASLAGTGPAAASGDGTVEIGADGTSRIGVVLTGDGVPAGLDRLLRVEARVDGTSVRAAFVEVPAKGSTTTVLRGDWGRCWKRAEVVFSSASDVPEVAGLLPRPLTLDGPGAAGGCTG